LIQDFCFHKRDKLRSGSNFPLDVTGNSSGNPKVRQSGSQAFPEHSDPGAQFDGRYSHITHSRVRELSMNSR
jgi:hypothetical protein